jgi:hypothetical protein
MDGGAFHVIHERPIDEVARWKLVARSRWRRTLMQEALITFAEGMTVLFDRGRRNGWVAEARVMLEVGRTTLRDIATRSVVAIMEALLVDSADRGWWRRIVDGLWVRTAG